MIHLEQQPRETVGPSREVAVCGKTVYNRDASSSPDWITCPRCCRIATDRAQASRRAPAEDPTP